MGKAYAQTLFLWLVFGSTLCAAEKLTTREVLRLALKNHPDVKAVQFGQSQAEIGIDAAGQRPNPELAGRGELGKVLGDQAMNNELGILHTFELGGKRSARIEAAEADLELQKLQTAKTREQTVMNTLLTLHLTRQAATELEMLEHSSKTFGSIVKMFASKKRLAPEQDAALKMFRLVDSDHRQRTSSVRARLRNLVRSLSFALQREIKLEDLVLPESPTRWPSVEFARSVESSNEYRTTEALVHRSQALSEQAKAQSWPDIRIGPSWTLQSLGPIRQHTFGANFSITLPFFHLNGAGREYSYRGIEAAEALSGANKKQLRLELDSAIEQYRSATEVLRETETIDSAQTKHNQIEASFRRGLVSSSLVFESHREVVDYIRNRHEQEYLAMSALWRIYVLSGMALDETRWP